ncbi:cell division protein FtsQ/DivIB [Blochmannia endosymbiont of Colobopsis nipponica]|uniref:cell division protein FtsQ/DivIB n=1 Tax=Blochmannia endosymbiont of Colobopsis nipponica TaxID=2681987 RepID=UPI00177F3F4D|nr:cell division protein FtsQ/DivIB [Blochmannia endosymbiont of Colobopsis nipponica]QOI11264.1 cell division protein FtsQ/DivIB [Blochmannia endosymbiont of Colobopsis nipponica]
MRDVSHLEDYQLFINGHLNYTIDKDINYAISVAGSNPNFMQCDVFAIHKYLKELSWIKEVSVRKQWPNILKIRIVEYEPVAYWNDVYMLDSNGVIFQIPTERMHKYFLPMLYGSTRDVLDLLTGYYLLNEIVTFSNFKIKSIKLDNRYSWQIILQDNIILKLGRKNKVKKLQNFIKIYPFFLESLKDKAKYISYIDLRYDHGFAVGWISSNN